MFEVPIDALYVWVGTALASVAALGVALSLTTAPPPDAAAAADTVDAVAGADHDATGVHPVDATSVKISAHSLALRDDGGMARERFAFGPVTPVREDSKLARVARGTPPSEAFTDPSALARAAREARRMPASWERTDRLRVRTVVWGDVRVTLVDA